MLAHAPKRPRIVAAQGGRWWKGVPRHGEPATALRRATADSKSCREFCKPGDCLHRIEPKRVHRVDVWRMVQRRAPAAGLIVHVGNHSFRATGITAYLNAGGTLENAQAMAAHESPRTTKLYEQATKSRSMRSSGSRSDAALTGYRPERYRSALQIPPCAARPAHVRNICRASATHRRRKGGDLNVNPASGARVSSLDD